MSKRNGKWFLADILESIEKRENYVSGVSFEDEKTKDAVVRNLEIIGEPANPIPPNMEKRFNEIPWQQMMGLRNRLIHGDFVVDDEIVWEIVHNELPELKEKIKKILEEEI